MMGWNNGYGYGGGFGMALMMLLFWLPLIGLGIWLIARATRSQPHTITPAVAAQHHAADSARALLDRRFASGEVSAEQYTEMRRVLESGADK